MAEVIWCKEALNDLKNIVSFIKRDDPAAADRIGQRLVSLGDSLVDFPARGRPGPNDTREMVTVPPFILVYRMKDDVVHILDIHHGRQRR